MPRGLIQRPTPKSVSEPEAERSNTRPAAVSDTYKFPTESSANPPGDCNPSKNGTTTPEADAK